jgi:hypothetical protein
MTESQFLLKLASEYGKLGFLDRALSALDCIGEQDTEHYQSAKFMKLGILLAKNDFAKVISLGEAMGGSENLPSESALHLAVAYWHVGAKNLAFQALQMAFKHVPSAEEVYDFLKAIPEHKLQPKAYDIDDLLEIAAQSLMGYHFALDNLAPLIWEARSSTCCSYEQIPILYLAERYPGDTRKIFLEFARDLYTEFNIYTAFFPRFVPASHSGNEIISMKIYFSKEENFYLRVREMENLYREEVTPWISPKWGPYMERDANFLDYPECCGKWLSGVWSDGRLLEGDTLASLVREDLKSAFWPELTAPHYAYFTFEFLPCDPRCTEAEDIWKRMADCYEKSSPLLHQLFEDHIIPLNKWRMHRISMPYYHFIRGFDESVENALGDFGKRLAQQREGLMQELSQRNESLH